MGSLGLFLFGMTVLSSSLQKSAGGAMKKLLGKMSKTRFRGVLFGAGVTAVIQSSTATTVMAVGFVNAGIISLTQIVGIIMGANIGSTTTSWLVSSVEWAAFLKPAYIGSACAAVGALMLLFSKKGKFKSIGEVIVGFGVLFIGLSAMPDAVKPLTELEVVRNAFVTFGNNPILALLVGILVTGVIQSSTASIGILQSMAVTGMIPWSAAVFIVLGQNVGTCFTTMLTSIGANRNTKAASYVHFVYNATGAVIFSVAAFIFFSFINPQFGAEPASSTNVSMIHTGYNIALLLILFPLGGLILKLAVKMAGQEKSDDNKYVLVELDEHILETPSYALENAVSSVNKLTDLIRSNISMSSDIFLNRKTDLADEFNSNATEADISNVKIRSFLTKLYNEHLSETENLFIAALINNLARLERISNRTRGIVKQAHEHSGEVSKETVEQLRALSEKTLICYDETLKAVAEHKHAYHAIQSSEEAHYMYENYKKGHLERVSHGNYDIKSGTAFLEVARHLSRIAKNSKNIAETVESEDNLYGEEP